MRNINGAMLLRFHKPLFRTMSVVLMSAALVPTAFAIVQAMRVLNEDSQRHRATPERTLTLFVGHHD